MNALLNYNYNTSSNFPPGLGFNQPVNFGAYQNFMTPSFSGLDSGLGIDSLSSALANVPMGNYGGYPNMMGQNMMGYPSNQASQSSQANLKNLLDQGIISKEEYRTQLRQMNGIMSKEEMEEAQSSTQNPAVGLAGDDLKKARTSNTGNYKVTKEHSAIASQLVDAAKEILKKEPEMMSEQDTQAIEKIFSEVNKNPMLAEAFVKEANETILSGKTTTLLGRFEQVLTKQQGQKAAKETISGIKENLQKNVEGRNSKLWSEFEEKSNEDSANVEYTTTDKIMNKVSKNPLSAATVGVTGGAALLWGLSKTPKGTGKFGLMAAGALALGYSIYNLCSSKD